MEAKFMYLSEVVELKEVKVSFKSGRVGRITPKDHLVLIKHSDYPIFMRICYQDLLEITREARKAYKKAYKKRRNNDN